MVKKAHIYEFKFLPKTKKQQIEEELNVAIKQIKNRKYWSLIKKEELDSLDEIVLIGVGECESNIRLK